MIFSNLLLNMSNLVEINAVEKTFSATDRAKYGIAASLVKSEYSVRFEQSSAIK